MPFNIVHLCFSNAAAAREVLSKSFDVFGTELPTNTNSNFFTVKNDIIISLRHNIAVRAVYFHSTFLHAMSSWLVMILGSSKIVDKCSVVGIRNVYGKSVNGIQTFAEALKTRSKSRTKS